MAHDVGEWLEGLELGKYAEAFVENGVDLRALPHLSEDDLKELGVLLGHRRILLAAIQSLQDQERAWQGEKPAVTTAPIVTLLRLVSSPERMTDPHLRVSRLVTAATQGMRDFKAITRTDDDRPREKSFDASYGSRHDSVALNSSKLRRVCNSPPAGPANIERLC